MRRATLCALMIAIVSMFATSCQTDIKNIENLNYANAIGVDYHDGKYYGYVQFVQLSSVAKSSDGSKGPAKTWVGEGEGGTFDDTFFSIYQTAQERIFWGHVTAIVVSEEAFKQGFRTIYDSLSRYYEFRLTPWVYATRQPIRDIFSISGFYEQSPISTILHEPKGIYSQTSLVQSVKLHRLMSQINEPDFTSCIPTLSINTEQWTINQKTEPKLMIDGAIFLKNERFKSYIPLQQLAGLRWVQKKTVRANIPVPNREEPSVNVIVDKPKIKLKLVNGEKRLQYDFQLKGKAYVVSRQNNKATDFQQLTAQTEAAIEKEIVEVFETGVRMKTDVLNLAHNLYRYHNRTWKAAAPAEDELLRNGALRTVRAHINITHSGTEKNLSIENERYRK